MAEVTEASPRAAKAHIAALGGAALAPPPNSLSCITPTQRPQETPSAFQGPAKVNDTYVSIPQPYFRFSTTGRFVGHTERARRP